MRREKNNYSWKYYWNRFIALILVVSILITSNAFNDLANTSAIDTETNVSIEVEPAVGGTVVGAGNYLEGDEVTLQATVNEGYEFLGWKQVISEEDGDNQEDIDDSAEITEVTEVTEVTDTKEEEYLSTDYTYTFTYVEPVDFVAVFELITYTIALSSDPAGGGTVTGGGQTGTSVTFESAYGELTPVAAVATPDSGYQFAGWYDGDERVYTDDNKYNILDPSYSFSATEDRTLVAKFEKVEEEITFYSITATVLPSESGSVSGTGSYSEGEMVTLVATPSAGYVFKSWSEIGGDVLENTSETYTFSATANKVIVANFEKETYSIDVNTSITNGPEGEAGGVVTIDDEVVTTKSYEAGEEVTIAAVTDEGYNFVNWTNAEGVVVSDSAAYAFAVEGSETYTANFSYNDITVTIDSSGLGYATGAGSYAYGETVTLKAYSKIGSYFEGWYNVEDDTLISNQAKFEFTAKVSVEIEARFGEVVSNTDTEDDEEITEVSELDIDQLYLTRTLTSTTNTTSSTSSSELRKVTITLDVEDGMEGQIYMNRVLVYDTDNGLTPSEVTFYTSYATGINLHSAGTGDMVFKGWFYNGAYYEEEVYISSVDNAEIKAVYGETQQVVVTVDNAYSEYFEVTGEGLYTVGDVAALEVSPKEDTYADYFADVLGWRIKGTTTYLSNTDTLFLTVSSDVTLELCFMPKTYEVQWVLSDSTKHTNIAVGDTYKLELDELYNAWYLYAKDGYYVEESYYSQLI